MWLDLDGHGAVASVGDAAKGGKCAGKVQVCCFTSARSWPELEVQGFGDSGIWQQLRSAGLRQLRVSLLAAGFGRYSPDWVGYQKQRLERPEPSCFRFGPTYCSANSFFLGGLQKLGVPSWGLQNEDMSILG